MKRKTIRIMCAVTAMVSLLSVVPIMFEFFKVETIGSYSYTVLGFNIYTNTEQAINIVVGVFGLLGLLWDLAFGAFAIIDGRYKNLLWRIIRYGYYYGIAVGLLNFAFIASFLYYYDFCFGSIIFLVLTAIVITIKFVLVFSKNEDAVEITETDCNI